MSGTEIRRSGMYRKAFYRSLPALVIAAALAAHAAPVPDLADGWAVMAVKAPDGAAPGKVLPENGEWKEGQKFRGRIPQAMEQRSRAGIAVFSGMPTIYFVHDAIRHNPDCTAQWRRCLRHWARTMRNWPCIVAASCGVNQICPERNMRPELFGQDFESNGVAQNIECARRVAREIHPNCLYFSHADGTVADISSSNLYFNFTPLQEREEWLGPWSTNGVLPWYAAEFGAPYYACWFHSRVPQMTEWLAVYYGDKAYTAEAETMLSLSRA